jgi:hypothetical protein
MRAVKLSPIAAALVLAVTAGRPVSAASPVTVETHVVLKIDALTVDRGQSKTAATAPETEIGPGRPGTAELSVPWGTAGGPLSVRVTATLVRMTPDGEAVLGLTSLVAPRGGAPASASREIRLNEEGSGLFDVYGEGDRRLLLTLHAEKVLRAVVRPPAEVGAPVQFAVEVLRVDGERVVSLETNELHTFVGQPVEYSFRRGQGEGLETVRVSLLPVSISGDVVTIDAEIDGALPGAGGASLISHRERIVASRQATSRLNATAGTTPSGYRFQVTPDF